MPILTVYHNPNFLAYRGDHTQIVLPTRPVASVSVPEGLSPAGQLEYAYAQTQHGQRPWYENPPVTPHLRSTAVGDLLADAAGQRHVVEVCGFQPYQPGASRHGRVPILSWANAQPGDLVGSPATGRFRVIARRLRPKERAMQLLGHIPQAQLWRDRPRVPRPATDSCWAVLVPVAEAVAP